MLKHIRLHLAEDEEEQLKLERELASEIASKHSENINAFQRYLPSVMPILESHQVSNTSIFCNKIGQNNIVDYSNGRVLYGFEPIEECNAQLEEFLKRPVSYKIGSSITPDVSNDDKSSSILQTIEKYKNRTPLPELVDVVVVLGIGIGHHIERLIEKLSIKHLIIYEPELQYFSCSSQLGAWRKILETAKLKNTSIYLQIEKDGRNIAQDLCELNEHFAFDCCYLYRHYNHPVFDAIYFDKIVASWQHLRTSSLKFNSEFARNDYRPNFTPSVDLTELSPLKEKTELFSNNINEFKQYFPNIHKDFIDHEPTDWTPFANKNGETNLLHHSSLCTWYGQKPKNECELQLADYTNNPHRDGLVLGYNGSKLGHYLHYEFVRESEELLNELEEDMSGLPSTIKSIIIFGLGAGYQLESLCANHTIEKLFICEPNRDFFYATLHTIDWQSILQKIDKQGGRVYINIGDDGTHLFRDLLNQFYAIGPYILANTYFFQSYYNTGLVDSLSQLREQLQVVISMGEYFDHAYYGIQHTLHGVASNYGHLSTKASNKLQYKSKEVPIFLVGNGPSLDYSLEHIKQWRESSIVVSCGTSLQVLHRHGITPDFHAEIEQNRSTFDWAVRLGDRTFLKQITLLSCNGIHPDTCGLYKDVLIAFKDGESSTVSNLNVLGVKNYAALRFAFPTVSNFALNLFKELGFSQLYLFGIDLGFVDIEHHHSKQSGYYNDKGEALYNYAQKNNTSLVVPGNFRKVVSTKHEFKVSRMIIEDALSHYSGECYNTSDGARIKHTMPLPVEQLLVTSSEAQKKVAITEMIAAFKPTNEKNYFETFNAKYQFSILKSELKLINQLISRELSDPEQIDFIIEQQKRILFDSYKKDSSLLFYFLYGTLNFANAMLVKISHSKENKLEKLNKGLLLWQTKFDVICELILSNEKVFDNTSSFGALRERQYMKEYKEHEIVYLVRINKGIETKFSFNYRFWDELNFCNFNATPRGIVFSDDIQDAKHLLEANLPTENLSGTFLALNTSVVSLAELLSIKNKQATIAVAPILPNFEVDEAKIRAKNDTCYVQKQFEVEVKKWFLNRDKYWLFIPRLTFLEEPTGELLESLNMFCDSLPTVKKLVLFPSYIALPKDQEDIHILDELGGRGKIINSDIKLKHMISSVISEDMLDRAIKIFGT